MDTVTYPSDQVVTSVQDYFVPVKIKVKERPELCEKYDVHWTPTVLFLNPEGKVIERVDGYLPPEDFFPQMQLALAKVELGRNNFMKAKDLFGRIEKSSPQALAAPEALYWAGVASYKGSGQFQECLDYWKRLREQYPGSEWSKKASFVFEK